LKVWLDDERAAPPGSVHARTPDDVVALWLAEEPFGGITELSLDHDLGDDADVGTGYDVLVWIERELHNGHIRRIPEILVHTQNPPARARMEAAVRAIYARHSQA
jgi:hypothetical protein